MIVVISDVHLGYEKCNKEVFESFVEEFLEKEKIEHLILLGDILDFWRRSNESVLFENMDILCKLNKVKAKKYYVIGNHDYSLTCLEQIKDLQFEFKRELTLENGDKKFKFIHGYQLDEGTYSPFYEDILCPLLCMSGNKVGGWLSDRWDDVQRIKSIFAKESGIDISDKEDEELEALIEFLKRAPEDREKSQMYEKEVMMAKELARRYEDFLKAKGVEYLIEPMKKSTDEILVYGHTHKPFCNKGEKANTGSWVSDAKDTNSYLIIDNGKMELKEWK